MNETLAAQSPQWDCKHSLAELLLQAKFFTLRKDSEVLAYIVHEQVEANGFEVYHYYGLSHDCCGITYNCDGSIRADYVASLIEQGLMELTQEPEAVFLHITECMECLPFSQF